MATVQLAPTHTKLLKTWTVLAQSAVAIPNTGSTTENTLATVSLPAATMGPNGALRIWCLWTFTNTANNKTMRIRLGATAFQVLVRTTQVSGHDLCFIRNRNAQNSQVCQPLAFPSLGGGSSPVVTGSIDTSAAQNITFTAQLAVDTETLTLESYLVEVLYGA